MGRNGSIHTIVLVLVMLIGFGAALGWPQYEKHRTIAAAQKALDIGKSLAFAEASYKEHYKAYTPDFELLGADLPCPVERADGKTEMVCSNYTFSLAEGNLVRVAHKNYPKWFDINIDQGSIDCSHEEGSLVGQHICDRVNLSNSKN